MGTSTGVQNVVSNVLPRNPVGNRDGSQISCAALRALALNYREQLIREQREDPEAAERRPVRSKQATAVRPCLYFLRSGLRQPEGFPEEWMNIGIKSIPQNIRRSSFSIEAVDGDPVDRSE
ncbi:hypothetical protein TNCV_1831 [Trichonephila clavipes]|nr:hypothetical protein TNCV_1831 [Trichonephila clavipes]